VTAVLAVLAIVHLGWDKLLGGRSVEGELHILYWTGWENSLPVEHWQLSAKDLWAVLYHELNEWGHLILDDIQTRAWPEETGSKADGKVNGIHAINFVAVRDVV
jgi:hypothetical protein